MKFANHRVLILLRMKYTTQSKTIFSSFKKNGFACQPFSFIHTSSRVFSENTSFEQPALVYEGPLKKRIKMVKLLSLSSSMIGFAMLPVVIKDLYQVSIALAAGAGLISTAFLSTPFLLHWITKRYITELHFNPETKLFTAKTFNIISQEKEFQFSASDVSIPDVPGMLSSFEVKKQPLFVDDRIVKDYDAYAHMMGYDKPMDFKLGDSEATEENKKN